MDETSATRIGDADRNRIAALLNTAFADGRITIDELNERLGQTYSAVTRHDLDVLVADLPPGVRPDLAGAGPGVGDGRPGAGPTPPRGSYPPGARPSGRYPAAGYPSGGYPPYVPTGPYGPGGGAGPARGPGPGSGTYPALPFPRPPRRSLVAVMSGNKVRGNWQPPPVISAIAFWGYVGIDLRHATFQWPVIEISACAIMGGVEVIVPPGMPVDLHGFVLMGGASDLTDRKQPPAAGAPLIRVKASGMWGGVTVRTLARHKSADDPEEMHKAWANAADDEDDDDLDVDLDEAESSDRPGDRRGRPSHRSGHGRRWPAPPAPPTLPRGLEGIIPPMPGQRQAARRRTDDARTPAAAAPPPSSSPPADATPAPAPAPGPAPAPPAATEPEPAQPTPAAVAAEGAPAPAAEAPPAHSSAASGDAKGDGAESAQGNGVRPTGRVLTMLVSDIVDSTQSAVRMGDQRWVGVLAAHDALFREQVRRYHGTEVKHQGDGFLVTFTSARQAVLAGIAIQRSMASHRTAFPDNDLHLRLGIHTGEVVEDDGDIFGANVITAVRIADAARPDEVLVSGLTHDLTESSGDLSFDDGREATLKGITRPSHVFAAAWG